MEKIKARSPPAQTQGPKPIIVPGRSADGTGGEEEAENDGQLDLQGSILSLAGQSTQKVALQNSNVRWTLIYTFANQAALSVWNRQLLPIFIEQISDDIAVGWMAAVAGFTQMLLALVAGYFADRYPRELFVRIAVTCGCLSVCLAVFGVYKEQMKILYPSNALWGGYLAFSSTGVDALFADSVMTGKRTSVYNLAWMIQSLSSNVGNAILLVMLLVMGNTWQHGKVVIVMYVGLLLQPFAIMPLIRLRDKYALREEPADEGPVVTGGLSGDGMMDEGHRVVVEEEEDELEGGRTPRSECGSAAGRNAVSNAAPDGEAPPENTSFIQSPMNVSFARQSAQQVTADVIAVQDGPETAMFGSSFVKLPVVGVLFTLEAVPYFLCLVDFLIMFGAGMTMRYMTLFLVNDCGATPVQFMIAEIVTNVGIASCASGVRYIGDMYLGRIPAVGIVRAVGAVLLLLMGMVKLPLVLVLPIYVVRSSLMRSTMGIRKSILMDCVKKENRAKWSAFESFTAFTWGGTAVFGGYLAAARGYQFAFVITALFQVGSCFLLLPAVVGLHDFDAVIRKGKWAAREARLARRRRR